MSLTVQNVFCQGIADARESYVVADAPSRCGEIRPAERLDRNAETFGQIAAR